MTEPSPTSNTFRDPLVNELAWIIGSVPTMSDHVPGKIYKTLDTNWFSEQLDLHLDLLHSLDEDPSELHAYLLNADSKLLGKRFECLVKFWLEKSPYFDLIASNIQFKSGSGTLGEADILVREVPTGRLLHMELACKFYLGWKNSPSWTHWIGPNVRDTLALKMEKLKTQLSIFETAPGKAWLTEQRLKQPEPVLMMKGYFFHHFRDIMTHRAPKYANKNYPAGWYIHLSESDQFPGTGGRWIHLEKHSWLSGVHNASKYEVISGEDLRDWLLERFKMNKRGVMIARIERDGAQLIETDRGYVVSDQWPGI